jgi:hypothetical protein
MSDVVKVPVGRPFKPGQSGNPSGRPKDIGRVRELARGHTEDAIRALVEALNDPKTKVHAATALLDRGWGKPPQVHGGEDGPVRLEVSWTPTKAG